MHPFWQAVRQRRTSEHDVTHRCWQSGEGGGSMLHTSGMVGKIHVGVLTNCSISKEYSCFTSDNLCCNTWPSDSTQNYALLVMLSCNSDYQGRCHCTFLFKLPKRKRKKSVTHSCSCFKECPKNSFCPAMYVFFTVNWNVSWHQGNCPLAKHQDVPSIYSA